MRTRLKLLVFTTIYFKFILNSVMFILFHFLMTTQPTFALDKVQTKNGSSQHAKVNFDLRIGALLPKNGVLSDYGEQTHLGFEFARKKLNELYPRFQLLLQDTQSTPQGAAEAANKLIADKVHILVGELATSNTQAAGAIAKTNRIPLISIGSTLSDLNKDNPYGLRICMTDEFQGHVLAAFALKNPIQAKKAYVVIDQDSPYSKELGNHFAQSFKKGGGQIIKEISFGQNVRDFKSIVAKMRKTSADVIFIPAYHQQVAPLLRELKLQKIKGHILGSDSWDSPGLIEMANGSAEGAFYSSHYAIDTQDKKSIDFANEFKAAMGVVPTTYSVMTYDAIFMAVEAALKNKGTAQLVKVLRSPHFQYAGVTGNIVIDKNGNPKKDVFIKKIENNSPKFWSKVSHNSVHEF